MKLYPEIVLACSNNKETARMVGGVKLYFIAKHYDRPKDDNRGGGSGLIHEQGYKDYLKRYLGVSRATYYRWKKQAKQLGLFVDYGGILQLVSWDKAAIACGCERVIKPVDVSIREFVDNEGLSEVWAGYIKRWEPKPASDKAPKQKARPITKTTLRTLSGIPESTQFYYESKAGVKRTPNIARIVCRPENAPAAQENGYYAQNGSHWKRMGSTHYAPNRIKWNQPGRTSKVNRAIRATLSQNPGSEQPERSTKLYFQPIYKSLGHDVMDYQKKRRNKAEKARDEAIKAGKPVSDEITKTINAPFRLYRKVTPAEQIKGYLRRLDKTSPSKRPDYIFELEREALGAVLWLAHDVQGAYV